MEEKLKSHFGEFWLQVLREYLSTPEFLQIGSKIARSRESNIIYPPSEKVFRIFKELPFEDVKVVMLLQDPYNEGSACGHALCNCESYHQSPSLKIVHQEIENEYPELTDRFTMPFGGMDKWDLTYLVKQGVFLYNCALTVEKGKPGSHMEIWKGFTNKIVETLNKKDFVVWLLLGKFAQEFESKINEKHICLKTDHPVYHVYNKNAKFLGSNCFKKVNNYLKEANLSEIIW
jgi:uracil-DNA glycosylase